MRVTDGRMDRQTEFSSLDRVCIPCSAVKTFRYITMCKACKKVQLAFDSNSESLCVGIAKNTAYRVTGNEYNTHKCIVTKSDLRDFILSTVVQHFVYHNTSDTGA